MRLLLAASITLAAIGVSGLAPAHATRPAADPPSDWVRKDPSGWVYWVPTKKWTHAHSACGIDISSPTGDMLVSLAGAPSAFALTTDDALTLVAESLAGQGVSRLRVVKAGPVTGSPGDQGQVVRVTGVRRAKPVTATASVRVTSGLLGNGVEAAVVLAPTSLWKAQAKTLGTILQSIRQTGTECIPSGDADAD